MPVIDEGTKEIQLHVAVVGGANEPFLSGLSGAQVEGGVHRMKLGQVQGYTPWLNFHSFPRDPWADDAGGAGERLEQLAAQLDALVFTDSADHNYSSVGLERLSRLLKPAKIAVPAAIFGSTVLEQEWSTLANTPTLYQGDPTPDHAMPAVKALAKPLLRAMMAATTTP